MDINYKYNSKLNKQSVFYAHEQNWRPQLENVTHIRKLFDKISFAKEPECKRILFKASDLNHEEVFSFITATLMHDPSSIKKREDWEQFIKHLPDLEGRADLNKSEEGMLTLWHELIKIYEIYTQTKPYLLENENWIKAERKLSVELYQLLDRKDLSIGMIEKAKEDLHSCINSPIQWVQTALADILHKTSQSLNNERYTEAIAHVIPLFTVSLGSVLGLSAASFTGGISIFGLFAALSYTCYNLAEVKFPRNNLEDEMRFTQKVAHYRLRSPNHKLYDLLQQIEQSRLLKKAIEKQKSKVPLVEQENTLRKLHKIHQKKRINQLRALIEQIKNQDSLSEEESMLLFSLYQSLTIASI